MEKYAREMQPTPILPSTAPPTASTNMSTPMAVDSNLESLSDDDNASPGDAFEQYCKKMIETTMESADYQDTWRSEMKRWLKDADPNVTPDIDLLQYWSVSLFTSSFFDYLTSRLRNTLKYIPSFQRLPLMS